MSAQHTPGPWVAKLEEAYYVTGPDLGRVAMMTHLKGPHGLSGRRSGEESAANARLISAAPDLLEALEKWLGPSDDPNAGWRGSGGDHEVYACEYCNAKHGDCTQIPHSDTCPIPRARAAIAKATGQKGSYE